MSNRILSYKGLLAINAMDTILLSTKKGEKGYRIRKFQLISNTPYQSGDEHIVQIWKEPETASASIDFSNNRLLGAGIINNDSAGYRYSTTDIIVFDNEIFNQDIYISHANADGSTAVNYYLELEVIMLNETEATVATLKDIRNSE